MIEYKIEGIASSKVSNFEFCAENNHYFYQYSPLPSNHINSKASLGIISHELVSNYLNNSEIILDENHLKQEFFKIANSKNIEFTSNYLEDREGMEFILRNLKTIKKIVSFLNQNDYEFISEHSYKPVYPFYGKVDIVLRKKDKSIIVDYKTGRVFDTETNILNSIEKQLLSYAYLELKEMGENQKVEGFVINKKGDFIKVESCNTVESRKYSEKIKDLIDEIKYQKIYDMEANFFCNECQKDWYGKLTTKTN